MLKKVKIIIALVSLSISLCLMSNTYSRYVADSTNSFNVMFAKWQILVNNTDITSNANSSMTFTPVLEGNANVEDGYIAPGATGYFDIEINAENVNVSFDYTITLAMENQNLPDLLITRYAFLDSTYVEGEAVETTNVLDNEILNEMLFDQNNPFGTYKVRIYFEWQEGEGETMNDAADTAAATANESFAINATISFKQII